MLNSSALALSLLVATWATPPKPATNGRCPVLGNPVADRNQAVTVQGRRYYICCDDCAQKLAADPGRFLEPDGTPKNTRQATSGEKIRDSY